MIAWAMLGGAVGWLVDGNVSGMLTGSSICIIVYTLVILLKLALRE